MTEVMIPTDGFPTELFGSPKLGWFIRLNDSARNWRRKRSEKTKSRMSEKSRSAKRGPRRMSRPELPKQTQVGTAKAEVSNQCVRVRWPGARFPSAMRFGCAVAPVLDGSVERIAVNGWPVCSEKIPETCQSR